MSVSNSIRLWPGVAPGSEAAAHREVSSIDESIGVVVRNVVEPSLTPVLPDPALANGTSVVIAPGGGFHMLSWDSEGTQVAEWFAQRGVTSFLLRYRLADTGETQDDFARVMADLTANWVDESGVRPIDIDALVPEVQQLAYADGREAVRRVRARATEWGLDPAKVGFLGFSAGAFVATAVAVSDDSAVRPDWVAPIYGGAAPAVVPADAPPLFAMVAADDGLCRDTCIEAATAWMRAGRPAELHVYERGGHGFGARKLGLPVDGWFERLTEWMQTHGLLP
jgi:acetyl esterase/lipase